MKHFFSLRPRLIAVIGICILSATLIPSSVSAVTRALVAWNVMVWMYLSFILWRMHHSSHETIRSIAEHEDQGTLAVLLTMSAASVASVAAIVIELATIRELDWQARILHYLLTGTTVFGSWCLVAILFAFHYALMFYRSPAHKRALHFPDGEQNPDYWDFLYFTFTIACAVQTSDISVMSRAMRKTVLLQTILSFLFNLAILGFSINIAAGLVA